MDRYASAWRRKMVEEDVVRVTQVSTSTSPNPDTSKQHRSRISLTTNPATSEKRVSKKPRMTNVQVQTDFTTEYGTLADHLFKEKVISVSYMGSRRLLCQLIMFFSRRKKRG